MNFKNGKTLQIVQKIVDPNDPNLFSVVIKGVKTQERKYMQVQYITFVRIKYFGEATRVKFPRQVAMSLNVNGLLFSVHPLVLIYIDQTKANGCR